MRTLKEPLWVSGLGHFCSALNRLEANDVNGHHLARISADPPYGEAVATGIVAQDTAMPLKRQDALALPGKSGSLWYHSVGQVVAALKVLEKWGVTYEHLLRLCLDLAYIKQVATEIRTAYGSVEVQSHTKARQLMGDWFFGMEEWAKYFGVDFAQWGEIPDFPYNLEMLIKSDPLEPEKQICETYFAYLMLGELDKHHCASVQNLSKVRPGILICSPKPKWESFLRGSHNPGWYLVRRPWEAVLPTLNEYPSRGFLRNSVQNIVTANLLMNAKGLCSDSSSAVFSGASNSCSWLFEDDRACLPEKRIITYWKNGLLVICHKEDCEQADTNGIFGSLLMDPEIRY